MNKTEFVDKIAAEAELSKKDADAAVKAVISVLTNAMAAGDKVALPGFGTFEVRQRAAREGHNPRTGEVVKIAAANAPAFKPGKGLKDAVNK